MVLFGAGSAFAAAAAANALNDALDVGSDRVNRPDRPVASGRVGVRAAVAASVALYAAGVALAAPVGVGAVALATAWVALTVVYSGALKRVPVVGNAVVGAVAASPLLMGGIAAGRPSSTFVPVGLAFLVHLSREAIKDAEDVAGDRAAGLATLAVVRGPGASIALGRVAMVAVMGLAAMPQVVRLFGPGYTFVLVPIEALLAWLVIAAGLARDARALGRVSAGLKLVMALGLLAFTLGALW
jgi:geranylgeranylglycerol-phosphate geranylgeranyltransferase